MPIRGEFWMLIDSRGQLAPTEQAAKGVQKAKLALVENVARNTSECFLGDIAAERLRDESGHICVRLPDDGDWRSIFRCALSTCYYKKLVPRRSAQTSCKRNCNDHGACNLGRRVLDRQTKPCATRRE